MGRTLEHAPRQTVVGAACSGTRAVIRRTGPRRAAAPSRSGPGPGARARRWSPRSGRSPGIRGAPRVARDAVHGADVGVQRTDGAGNREIAGDEGLGHGVLAHGADFSSAPMGLLTGLKVPVCSIRGTDTGPRTPSIRCGGALFSHKGGQPGDRAAAGGSAQSIGAWPWRANQVLAAEKWPQPRKPRCAESGEVCGARSTRWRRASIIAPFFCA